MLLIICSQSFSKPDHVIRDLECQRWDLVDHRIQCQQHTSPNSCDGKPDSSPRLFLRWCAALDGLQVSCESFLSDQRIVQKCRGKLVEIHEGS